MTLDAVKNFAFAKLIQGYDENATVIISEPGTGNKFPDPAQEGEFNLVWWNKTDYQNAASDANVEIVRCVARAGDNFTIIRGQEGTPASVKNLLGKEYQIELNVTSKLINDIDKRITDIEQTSNFNNEILTFSFLGT